ncbi:MAG: ATP-binding protein [Sphingobium sp.]|nr:ATP-binding protein [Sphingobium sp.]
MSSSIIIGTDPNGTPVPVDMEELLATRLLVQGNSGSGKSHLLRRMLEESARMVQQVIIDPEGDFVTLAEPFGHVVIDGSAHDGREIERLAARIREHRASVVLALDGLELESQMRCAAQFLSTLFDAPRDFWYPALVVVDEAQMFAPAAAGDVSDETRRLSLAAMTNLMCRGRKRGLAGVIATQRLAKLAKNVAAEASNFLMGRTFLDIDMARAADLLGMERRQAEQIRDLERGRFLALGPAICRRPQSVKIGDVQTSARTSSHKLMPLPTAPSDEMTAMLFAGGEGEDEPLAVGAPEPAHPPQNSEELLGQISHFELGKSEEEKAEEASRPAAFDLFDNSDAVMTEIMNEMVVDPDCAFQPIASLYQDFTVRCRMRQLAKSPIDLPAFRRRYAVAIAGMENPDDARWADALKLSERVTEDILAPFLMLARAAVEGAPCPNDDDLARAYGTQSAGRVRRLIEYMERNNLIVIRTDFGGRRSVGIPELGLSTAPMEE